MSDFGKIVAFVFVIALLASALVIRHRESGYRNYYARNYVRARVALTTMAENDVPLAAYYLGQIYNLGRGISIDRASAKKWFLRSARMGSPDGAVMYLFTDSMPQAARDSKFCSSTIELLNTAAQAKNAHASLLLGEFYAKGVCGQVDSVKSAYYYSLARKIDKFYGTLSKYAVDLLSPSEKNRLDILLNSHFAPISEQQFLAAFLSWIDAPDGPGRN